LTASISVTTSSNATQTFAIGVLDVDCD